MVLVMFFFFKQKTAYVMRISDWSSDVCSSDLTCQRGAIARIDRGPPLRRTAGDRRRGSSALACSRPDSIDFQNGAAPAAPVASRIGNQLDFGHAIVRERAAGGRRRRR